MIELQEEHYKIEQESNGVKAVIHVVVNTDGQITIDNDHKQRQFAFTKSDSDLVMAMGKCFVEASTLADKMKDRAKETKEG